MTDSLHDNLDQLLKGQAHSLSQIMQRNILTCAPDLTVVEAAEQMVSTRCSSIVVLEKGKPVGIWTEHDALLVNPDDDSQLDRAIGQVMSQPVRTINMNVTIEAATLRFRDEGLRHYIVVDDKDNLVGVVSQSDVVRQHDVRHFLSMRAVGTVVRRSTLILQASSSLPQAASRLHNHGTDCAVVIFGDGRRGIVTERDLLKAVARRKSGLKVGDVSNTPIISVPQSVSVLEARETMERKGIRHLGVTDGEGTPVGMLSYGDILASVEFSILRYVEEMLAERSRALNMTQNRLRGALDQLHRSNEELEEFVRSVADGLKKPLADLADGLSKADGSDVQGVAQARAACELLQTMLWGIEEFARAGRSESPLTSTDLQKVLLRALAHLSERIAALGVKIDHSFALPTVKGDPVLLERLFVLLIENAIALRDPARQLTVRLHVERRDGHWNFTVSDNGRGIAQQQIGAVFQLFHDCCGNGPGVGLALARRIVERHGGRVWIESNPGVGTTVGFTLSSSEGLSSS